MDRASAFLRRGVLGSKGEERKEEEGVEEEEMRRREGEWSGCSGMRGFGCQQQDIKVWKQRRGGGKGGVSKRFMCW